MTSINKLRRISPSEQIYLAMNQGFPPCAIQLWIVADSLFSRDELERALGLAARSNIGARLVVKGKWWVDSGISPRVRSISPSENAILSHEIFHEAFTCNEIPPIEVVFWEGQGLVFRCSHALMDAGGLLFFAEETFRALRREPLRGSSANISDFEYLRALAHSNQRTLFAANAKSPLGASTGAQSGFVWEARTIPGQISAVGARIASSLSKLADERDAGSVTRFMFPVDFRYLDPSVRTTDNFSNPLFLESTAVSSWNEFYGWTLEAFSRHDERATSRWDALLPWAPLPFLNRALQWTHARQIRAERYFLSGIVSHVGTVALDSFATRDFTPSAVRLMPFDAPASAITLVTLQHENGLEVSASCPAATGGNGLLGKALDLICSELEGGRYSDEISYPRRIGHKPIVGERKPLSAEHTVSGLFAMQVGKHPDRTAVSDEGRTFTYAELDRLSLACALQLQARGIQPGDKVAVLSGKSSDTIVALLGIMRLGAAFVPLDPEWPNERIAFVLEDCCPACVVSGGQNAKPTGIFHCVHLSELCQCDIGTNHTELLQERDSIAYVLYTSGSTGRPKGVVVGQRSLLNYLMWAQDAYLENLDVPVFPFFTSLAFDLTLTSIFLPLVTGGEVRVIQQQDPLSAVRTILSDSAINAVKLTPSHLWIFWSSGIGNSGLRKFIVGGEALPTRLAREIVEQSAGHAEIFNEYGPTEATVGCVVHRYDPQCDVAAYVPIGRPIANTEVVLLDENLRVVSVDVPGEIFLAGDCLALGYLARPEEDARFMPHPMRDGVRMYRTGDRALLSRNGELEYLGRTDGQVKVRGCRVEIGEIESAIESSELCRAFTVAPELTSNGLRLVAFVTWREGAAQERLQAVLAATLPAYMIPSHIVAMDQLPLNINGKIDRSRLPVHFEIAPQQCAVCEEDSIEDVLADIAASLPECSLRKIPYNQSLLELGFDSLQMMLLLSIVERRYFSALPHDDFFSGLGEFIAAPTLQNLAKHLRTLGVGGFDSRRL